MVKINSVLGLLDTGELGFTLMHEHIVASAAGISQTYPEFLGENYIDRLTKELTQYKSQGINTIVDATTIDLGRDVSILAEVSQKSGVNIISCTGWWLEIPRILGDFSADHYARLFIRDITEGIENTRIKAGIIKSASDIGGVSPATKTVLRGIARAQIQTNVPIMLHSYSPGQVGRQQIAILKEEGVNLKRVKLDHSDDTADIEYLTWILEQGCYLGMDRLCGLSPDLGVSAQSRVKMLKSLIDAGYADRLLLSHDYSLISTFYETVSQDVKRARFEANPYGLYFIKKVVLPQLLELGIPEKTVSKLCFDNPRAFFEG